MPGDEELFAFLDDLESRAGALYDAERRVEVADRARAEYRQVTLAARLMASVGHEVSLGLRGPGPVTGTLDRVGPDWCALQAPGSRWVVRLAAVATVAGAATRAVPEVAWRAVDRVGLASPLRRLAEESVPCQVHLEDGTRREGAVGRVGADFLELAHRHQVLLVALDHVAAVSAVSPR